MKRSSLLKLLGAALLAAFVWVAWPVYGFFAHNGAVPMLPFGWMDMPAEAPTTQSLNDGRYKEAGDRVLEILAGRRAQIGAPAYSAAVGIDGKLVWAGAAGWADIKSRKPVTLDTQFRIGSTSKAVTATALARLVDNGTIALDTPLADIFDDLPNDAWAKITPRQLASHMAGIPHYNKNTDWLGLYATIKLSKHYDDVRDALKIFDGSKLLFEPGTDFSYSSLGTVLLGAAMSEAAGKPYRAIIRDEVLEPAGMTATIVAPRRAPGGSNLATFYFHQGDQYREWRPVDLSHRLPGGGFASTPSDLVRMGLKQLEEGYISPETRAAFWTPQKLISGETNEQDYAIGWRWREWEVEGAGAAHNANHGGVSRGSQCWLIVFPERNMVIAFTINMKTEEFSDFGGIYADIFREFAQAQQSLRSAAQD